MKNIEIKISKDELRSKLGVLPPMEADDIATKLETLEGNERLNISAINGLDDYDEVRRLAKTKQAVAAYGGSQSGGTGGSGATAFTALTDVPSSYAGQSGKLVSVKATEDGLEFTAPGAGSGDITRLQVYGIISLRI
jgi:hypothetical protein